MNKNSQYAYSELAVAKQIIAKFKQFGRAWPHAGGIVSRGFLFDHLYHPRGEMIVYLRATGNKVPGMWPNV